MVAVIFTLKILGITQVANAKYLRLTLDNNILVPSAQKMHIT